jgi:hypothetical protein
VTVDRATSKYEVRSRRRENGNEKVLAGDIDLPRDTYNGMIVTTLMNLPKASSESVQVLAFTPEPVAIPLELSFVGEQVIRVGEQSRKALQYTFKPDIGPIKTFLGKILGKLPADFHYAETHNTFSVADFVRRTLRLSGPVATVSSACSSSAKVFSLLIKQLPRLLPVVTSMLERPPSRNTEDGRLAGIEQSIEWLAERSDAIERRLKRLTMLVLAGLLLSVVAFVLMLVR